MVNATFQFERSRLYNIDSGKEEEEEMRAHVVRGCRVYLFTWLRPFPKTLVST